MKEGEAVMRISQQTQLHIAPSHSHLHVYIIYKNLQVA